MSLFGDILKSELVWKALSDRTRREILDLLRQRPRTTGEICGHFRKLSRTAVLKHIAILERANLLLVRPAGRFRWNFLNPVPIRMIYQRWITEYTHRPATALVNLKKCVERSEKN